MVYSEDMNSGVDMSGATAIARTKVSAPTQTRNYLMVEVY